MPLRMIRVPQPVINKEDALRIALTTSALAKELSSLSAFPPLVAAASILLLIFQTVQVSIENWYIWCFTSLLVLNRPSRSVSLHKSL